MRRRLNPQDLFVLGTILVASEFVALLAFPSVTLGIKVWDNFPQVSEDSPYFESGTEVYVTVGLIGMICLAAALAWVTIAAVARRRSSRVARD